MEDGTPTLQAPVVTPAQDPALVHENGAYRNPALLETLPGLLHCRLEELVHSGASAGPGPRSGALVESPQLILRQSLRAVTRCARR